MKLDFYTGYLIYKDILFSFSFYNDELRLIPPNDKISEISRWGLKKIESGGYIPGDSILIEDEYLVGTSNETGNLIVFFPTGHAVGKYNEVLRVRIRNFMILNNDQNICGLAFYSEEIELIYPPNKTFNGYQSDKETGDITVHTKKSHTSNDNIKFKHRDIEVCLTFYCERTIKMFGGKEPIAINSVLSLTFEETNDYSFIFGLYHIVEKLIMFMFNTKHISTQKCILKSAYDNSSNKSRELISTSPYQYVIENEILDKKKCIRYDYLKTSFSKILQDISDGKIYLRHLPDNYEDSRAITPSRFVMIVAGFENLFNLLYPNGVVHKNATMKKNEEFKERINEFIEKGNLNSEMKRKFNRIVKELNRESVEARLKHVYKFNKELIDYFANLPFQLNHVEFEFEKVAENVQKYRNFFAHGGVFDDFDINALLGLALLEKINYIMQLKYYGLSDDLIKKSVNDLFHCCLMIND